jgi:membrane-bound lytic murein transglycosylase F
VNAKIQRLSRNVFVACLALWCITVQTTCDVAPPLLAQIQELGELRVITRNSPTVYYESADGPAGYEYELLKQFADELGVELKLTTVERFTDLLPDIARGQHHIAAAGITITPGRERWVAFGPPIQEIRAQLVYKRGAVRPRTIEGVIGQPLEVVADSNHSAILRNLQQQYPLLSWAENFEDSDDELVYRVAMGELPYTVADSNVVAINSRYHPKLGVALELGKPMQLAWAFKKSRDQSLLVAAEFFFGELLAKGEMDRLHDRYYGHIPKLDYPGSALFGRMIRDRLPTYRKLFKSAGAKYDIDWRLLAAMGYQESHWDPLATSPTGVRGIMMLTRNTAKEVGVSNRLNPTQSIFGGAKYLYNLKYRLPDSVSEPDRTWFTLAAYNVGLGHVRDALKMTSDEGDNPNFWVHVRGRLNRLSQPKWNTKTAYGYARGHEAVDYVENIRSYRDILIWHTEKVSKPIQPAASNTPQPTQEAGDPPSDNLLLSPLFYSDMAPAL